MRVLLLVLTCTVVAAAVPVLEPARLNSDLNRLHAFSRQLRAMEAEMLALNKQTGVRKRGYYTADENDAIESLLFRYLVCRDGLWEMVASYREAPAKPTDDDQRARAFVLGLNAALKLMHSSSLMVLTYLDDAAVIDKLNEAHLRYDIPRGAYDLMLKNCTDRDNLRDLEAAWQLFVVEAGNPATALYRVSMAEPGYRELIAENYRFRESSQAQVAAVLKGKSIVLPEVTNWMRHNQLSGVARSTWQRAGDKLYDAKGVLFKNVGRIRRPLAGEAALSKRQIRAVRKALQPGDILLTYSSGYMSNIFLPGKFKHGIVYVGTPEQRRQMGLDMAAFAGLPKAKQDYLGKELARSELATGEPAELVESIAQGVIHSSLDRILGGHVYRMVVLRPRLDAAARTAALAKVYGLLGGDYDFDFDFDDASYICCTEVIYRAFHGKGGIAFPLTKRMGIPTLSADDIIAYAQGQGTSRFDPVLFVDTVGRRRKKAEVLHQQDAKERLVAVMAGE